MYRLIKMFLLATCMSCGNDPVIVEKEVPVRRAGGGNKTGGGNTSTPISYNQMQGLLNANCVQCHAGADFMLSEALLRRSAVKAELTSKNMPPNRGALSDGDRSLMRNFFL